MQCSLAHILKPTGPNTKNIAIHTLEPKKPNWELYHDLINKNLLKNPIQIDTESKLCQTQINSIITQFSKIIRDAANIEKHIGKTNSTHRRKTVPWWNKECKEAIKNYKKCLNKFKKTKSLADHINLKKTSSRI